MVRHRLRRRAFSLAKSLHLLRASKIHGRGWSPSSPPWPPTSCPTSAPEYTTGPSTTTAAPEPRLRAPDRGLPGPPRAAVGDHQAPPRQQPLPDGGHRRRLRFSGEPFLRRPRRAGVRRRLRRPRYFQPAVPCVGPHAEGEAPAGGGGAPGRRNPPRAAAARGAPPPSVQQQLLHRERVVERVLDRSGFFSGWKWCWIGFRVQAPVVDPEPRLDG
ncbi:hypothetical protein DH2020_033320 [Rehmannia glutinosa]|uniref:Uncharacterized protein n=1 Tax=Rehmannia glutinosa TaxID=99300 RepID=A0ABR0VCV7_REHGL